MDSENISNALIMKVIQVANEAIIVDDSLVLVVVESGRIPKSSIIFCHLELLTRQGEAGQVEDRPDPINGTSLLSWPGEWCHLRLDHPNLLSYIGLW